MFTSFEWVLNCCVGCFTWCLVLCLGISCFVFDALIACVAWVFSWLDGLFDCYLFVLGWAWLGCWL